MFWVLSAPTTTNRPTTAASSASHAQPRRGISSAASIPTSARGERDAEVGVVAQRGRDLAEQDVAHDAAAEADDEREDRDREQVEVVAVVARGRRERAALHAADGDGGEVDPERDVGDGGLHGRGSMPHMSDGNETHAAQLLAAAERGDVHGVVALIQAGADVGVRDHRNRTAVTIAAFSGHAEVVTELIAAGADVNAQDDERYNAVLSCGVTGDVEVLRAVLRGNPDLRIRNKYGGIAIIPAAERGHVALVRELLDTHRDRRRPCQ